MHSIFECILSFYNTKTHKIMMRIQGPRLLEMCSKICRVNASYALKRNAAIAKFRISNKSLTFEPKFENFSETDWKKTDFKINSFKIQSTKLMDILSLVGKSNSHVKLSQVNWSQVQLSQVNWSLVKSS